MTAPLDFSTATDAMPAFGVLPADMAGKSLGLDRVRELLALRDAAISANQPRAGGQAPPGRRAKIVSRTIRG